MNSSGTNAEPLTPEEEIYQSVEQTQEPKETTEPESSADKPGSEDEGDSSEEQISDADEDSEDDSDEEDEIESAEEHRIRPRNERSDGFRRFARSRAPSPEDSVLRNGYQDRPRSTSESDMLMLQRRVEGASSFSVRSSTPVPFSTREAAADRVTRSPSMSESDAAPPDSSVYAGSDIERTDE